MLLCLAKYEIEIYSLGKDIWLFFWRGKCPLFAHFTFYGEHLAVNLRHFPGLQNPKEVWLAHIKENNSHSSEWVDLSKSFWQLNGNSFGKKRQNLGVSIQENTGLKRNLDFSFCSVQCINLGKVTWINKCSNQWGQYSLPSLVYRFLLQTK